MTTVAQIITDAMVDAGKLMEGGTPSATQYTTNLRKLNDLINLWQTQGLKLWLERDVSITLVAGTASYTVTSGGLRVPRGRLAYWVNASGERRPVHVESREEYTRHGNTTTQGTVTHIFVEKLVTSTKVWCYMVPNAAEAAGTLHFVGQVQATNFTATSDDLTISFPQEWAIALRWGLADEICTGQSQAIQQRCSQRATQFRDALEEWDVEDVDTRFSPTYQQHQESRFK